MLNYPNLIVRMPTNVHEKDSGLCGSCGFFRLMLETGHPKGNATERCGSVAMGSGQLVTRSAAV